MFIERQPPKKFTPDPDSTEVENNGWRIKGGYDENNEYLEQVVKDSRIRYFTVTTISQKLT